MAVDEDHPALIKASHDDKIWRYLDLEKFKLLLEQQALFLCRSDKFSDPYEGTVTRREYENRVKEEIGAANFFKRPITLKEAQERSKNTGELHKRFKRAFAVNCWHINNGESDAMWRLYLKTNEGVAVQSTVGKLIESISNDEADLFISKIRYLDYENDIWRHKTDYPTENYNLITPIVHKRNAFRHENELRLVKQFNDAQHDKTFWSKQDNINGYLLPVNLETLVDKIILPPTSDEAVTTMVTEIISHAGFKFKQEKSELDNEPYY